MAGEGSEAPAPWRPSTLTVLGSGTLVPDPTRHGAAHLLRSRATLVLMDCGHGTVDGLVRYGVTWPDITHVLITHFHPDHVGDLPALLQALKHGIRPPRVRPLHLIGPAGFGTFLDRLTAAMGPGLLDPAFPLRVIELTCGTAWEDPGAELRIRCVATPHTPESVAYRLEVPGATVGYTGDTGPSTSVASFLEGCDMLVAECTQPDPPDLDTHLSPAGLARLAKTARPGLLVVTHVAPPAVPEEVAAALRLTWGGTVVAGHDGLVIPLR